MQTVDPIARKNLLTPPTHRKKVVGRNGMEIGLSLIQICMKTAFLTHKLSKTKFLGFAGSKCKP